MDKLISFDQLPDRLKKGPLNITLRVIAVGILICLIFFLPKAYHTIWPTPYKALKDNFQIVFPGIPTIKSLTPINDSFGGKQSGRVYNYLDQKSGDDYAVYVTVFSNLNSSALPSSTRIENLQYNLEKLAQIDSASLSNGKTITFENLNAVEAKFTPSQSEDASTDILTFFHDSDLYMIIGSGMSQSKFNTFSNSFKII